jgi:MinD-like ATPase involved in chromosome partitioning or flagellar assembly
MALANVAVLLARRGKKVLAVDWDLEAPGLPRYFAYLKPKQDGLGLLQLLLTRGNSDSSSDYKSYLSKVEDTDSGMSFDVLPSGHEADPDYSRNLERFDWHTFFREGGGDFFEKLRAQWKAEYDIVLIDSRTGLTDSGGICTIQMPDIVVAMFTANYQSLYGVRDVMRLAQQSRQRLSFDRMLMNVIPLPSRFGTRSEFRESKKWLDEFANAMGEFFAEWLPSNASPRQVLERMKIPQVDYFSFGERLAVVEDSSSDSEGMTPPYNMLTDLIESDLKNLSTILPPESWKVSSQRESTKRAKSADDGYQYDIYLSYDHDVHTTSWVREQFWPLLLLHLETLSPNKLTPFFDLPEVRTHSHWESILSDALKGSRVCLAFFTPRYFRSSWSVSELETFLKRSREVGHPLVLPVLLAGDNQHLPREVRDIQIADFSDYFFTSAAFRNSPKSLKFEDAVRQLAGDLIKRINEAPPFNPNWRVVNPGELRNRFSAVARS